MVANGTRVSHVAAVAFALLMTVGCADWNSIHKQVDMKQGSVLIDIKQRAILTGERENSDGVRQLTMCAEPSPDALSAYAAALSAKVDTPQKVGIALGAATQEQSQFVGLRTQSIQLLRDGFYRGCEAYMNGALTPAEYAFLVRRYQKYMVAILAIEQLTGAVKATAYAPLAPTPPTPPNVEGSSEPAASPSPASETPPASSAPASPSAASQPSPKPTESVASASSFAHASLKRAPGPGSPIAPRTSGKPEPKPSTSEAEESTPAETPSSPPKTSDLASISADIRRIVEKILDTDDRSAACFAYLASKAVNSASPLYGICTNVVKNETFKLEQQ